MDVRALGRRDWRRLSNFSCAGSGIDSHQAQKVIREQLADSLDRGDLEAAGLFVNGALVGVSAWLTSTQVSMTSFDRDPTLWFSNVLAVAHGHRGNGYAKHLKSRLLGLAREAGATYVTSYVHEDNDPMIAVNRSLGGVSTRDPMTQDFKPSPYLIFRFRLLAG